MELRISKRVFTRRLAPASGSPPLFQPRVFLKKAHCFNPFYPPTGVYRSPHQCRKTFMEDSVEKSCRYRSTSELGVGDLIMVLKGIVTIPARTVTGYCANMS